MLRQFVRSLLLEAMAPIDSKTLSAKVWGKLFSQDIRVDEHDWQWRTFYVAGNRNYPSGRSDLMVSFSIEGYAPGETPPAKNEEEDKDPMAIFMQGNKNMKIKREFMKSGPGSLGGWMDSLRKLYRDEFGDFVARRGWNLLYIYVEPIMGTRPQFAIKMQIDANPHKTSTNYLGLGKDMDNFMFLHLTDSKNVAGIKRKGFIQSRATSDDRRFGTTGRTYLLRVTKQEYREKMDEIIEWMKTAPEGFAGIGEVSGKSVIVVDGGLVEEESRFYIDTEFGRQGSGFVFTDGKFNAKAVYTTHQLHPMSISQTFDL